MTQSVMARWRRWVEPWYLAYALLGATTGGLVAIFLPLGISKTGSAAHIGFVMSIVAVGQLTAGMWGTLADRLRIHRLLFAGGTAAVVLVFLGFATEPGVVGWAALALVLGLGSAAANTVANLFIVEAHPKPEWDERIGALQAAYNIGVVGGLGLASALSHLPLRVDFLTGAVLTAIAAVLGWATTRTPPRAVGERPSLSGAGPEPEWATNTPQRASHWPSLRSLGRLGRDIRTPFGLFIAVWLVANLGLAAVNGLYPVMMRDLFGVQPRASSALMAVATGASILLYAPSSALAKRLGGRHMLHVALLGRAAALLALMLLGLSRVDGRGVLAAVAFGAVVLAGPLFTVSGTIIASNLAPAQEGEALGVYNASGSLGALFGSAVGGWAASRWGYEAAPVLGFASMAAALLLGLLVRLRAPVPAQGGVDAAAPTSATTG